VIFISPIDDDRNQNFHSFLKKNRLNRIYPWSFSISDA